MTNRLTQSEKLLARLSTGENLTVSEAKSRLGVKRLAARIHEFRSQGLKIYTNKVRVKSGPNRGKKITAYRMSTNS